jgi:lipoprotein-releasing system permease protein
LNFSYYIGRKLTIGKEKSFTKFIIRLAILGVALSLSVMLVSISIVDGFSHEIKSKIAGYSGHIQVVNLDLNQSDETEPISYDSTLRSTLERNSEINRITPIAAKTGILQTDEDIEGLLFKGLPHDYNWDFFGKHIKLGRRVNNNDSTDTYECMISVKNASKLGLDTGQMIDVFFMQKDKVRRRRLKLVGLFQTGLEELDKKIVLTDMRVIQRIYSPDYDLVSSYEIWINDLNVLDPTTNWVDDEIGLKLKAQPIYASYYVMFQWLRFVDYNAIIIITLMLFVAIVNCITALLVLIIERTNMVGILKALGATNQDVGRIFLYKGMYLIGAGLLLGNGLALLLAGLQKRFGLVKLNEETYYMDVVPIQLDWMKIIGLNLGTFLICFLILLVPIIMVRRISPIKAIRYE